MILQRLDQVRVIDDVWQPRYSTKDCLIACWKIDKAHTNHIKIIFSKAGAQKGPWYISKKMAQKCKKFDNHGVECYIIPMDKLEHIEYNEKDMRELW